MQGSESTTPPTRPARRREPIFGGLRFWRFDPFSRFAAAVLLGLAVISIVVDIASFVADPDAYAFPEAVTLLGLTAALALTAWRPPAAATVMIGFAILAIGTGVVPESAIALAAVSGFVVRSCSKGFVIAFGVAFLSWLAVAVLLPPVELELRAAPVLTIIAAGSSAIGLFFRIANRRETTLTVELGDRARTSEEAVRLERERIAGELHDIVAHDLTIIAMHARVLDRVQDEEARALSQKAIGDSAHQALIDLRRMLTALYATDRLTAESLDNTVTTDSLASVLDTVAAEFEAAGIATTIDRPAEIRLPRSVDNALGRIARESATNVVKHAASTASVSIVLRITEDRAALSVSNTPPRDSRRMNLPSSGFGLVGMRERAELFGGTFAAGSDDRGWTVAVELPLTQP